MNKHYKYNANIDGSYKGNLSTMYEVIPSTTFHELEKAFLLYFLVELELELELEQSNESDL